MRACARGGNFFSVHPKEAQIKVMQVAFRIRFEKKNKSLKFEKI